MVRIRRPTGTSASPLPGRNENCTEQQQISITLVSIGGER